MTPLATTRKTNMMRRLTRLLTLLAAILTPPVFAQPLNHIAAIVNSTVITSDKVNQAASQIVHRLKQANQPLPPQQLLNTHVLNQLINQTLLLQLAKRANVTVSTAELSQAIKRVASRKKMSVADFERTAMAQSGISKSALLTQIKTQLIISKVQQSAIAPQVHITAAQVAAAYKHYQHTQKNSTQYLLSNILIALPSNADTQTIKAAQDKAKTLLKQLHAGDRFAAVSRASSDASNALSGGSLGWSTLNTMPTIFAKAVSQHKSGSIIGPIRAPNGLHILKIVSLKDATSAALSQQDIYRLLFEKSFEAKLQKWLNKMRTEAFVKIIKA